MKNLIFTIALLVLTGCPGYDKVGQPAPRQEKVESIAKTTSIQWFEIIGKKKLIGYVSLKIKSKDGRKYEIYNVFDQHYKDKGYYLEQGNTISYDYSGRSKDLGKLTPKDSIRRLFGLNGDTEIQLRSLDEG